MTTMKNPSKWAHCAVPGCNQLAIVNKDGTRVCTRCVMLRCGQLIKRDLERRREEVRKEQDLLYELNRSFHPHMGL